MVKTLEECDAAIYRLKERRKELLNENWQANYKERCELLGCEYVSLEDALSFIHYEVVDKEDDDGIHGLCNELSETIYNGRGAMSLSKLIKMSYELGLKIWDISDLAKMICGLCVCRGCAEEKHCNGYSCKECKLKGYIGYDWECEE